MLRIRKGAAPACLSELQSTPGADWGSVSGAQKQALRDAVRRDQGGLCAYCMGRVWNTTDQNGQPDLTIEHLQARSGGADPFHWPDLLGVCKGKTGQDEHCDRARGDQPLRVHPVRDDIEALTRYLGDGTLELDQRLPSGRLKTRGHQADVDTLRLNVIPLKHNRRQVIDAVLQRSRQADATELRRQIDRWTAPDEDGDLPPYAGVALSFLRRALQHRESRASRVRSARRS